MDIKLPPKPWYVKYRLAIALGIALTALMAYTITLLLSPRTVYLSADRMKAVTAAEGSFTEYIDVEGIVHPIATILLNARESGSVQRIVSEEGSLLHKGDTIIVLTNDALINSIRQDELEWEKTSRNLKEQEIQMEQKSLALKQQTLDQEHQIANLNRQLEQSREEFKMGIKSKAEMDIVEADYVYQHRKMELQMQSLKHDSASTILRREMIRAEYASADRKLAESRRRLDNLVVTSPTDGQLGRLNLTIGQNVSSGATIGELKIMNNYKVRTQLSEYYVERINAGLPAMILQKKDTIPMRISRVMPEVKDRMFEADLVFLGHTPDNIRLGKSYRVKIELGQPESALIIPRGDFYQHTGGKWIFRIDPETGTARRTEIEIGRQNPEQFEILSGLAPGDSVILSGYERFLQAEQIKIEK